MGGVGSTRWKDYTKKRCVEDTLTMSVQHLHSALNEVARTGQARAGLLRLTVDQQLSEATVYVSMTQNEGRMRLRMVYGISGDLQREMDYTIAVDGMPSKLVAGVMGRWYFVCPECEQWRTKLYLPPAATIFACRRCHNLTYRSCQQEYRFDRTLKVVTGALGCEHLTITRLLQNVL